MGKDIAFSELIEESYQTAKDKGWWDDDLKPEDLGLGMKIALMHSELSEALEEYRDGHDICEIWYRDDGKPEGIPAEFADVIIRIADYCGHHKVPLCRAIQEKLAFNKTRPHRHGGKRA